MDLVTGFPILSSFVVVMFQGRPFGRLRGLNIDSPAACTAFVANSRFLPPGLSVGRQK